MWLPNRIYRLLPWAYVVIGLLFFAGVYYIDQRDFGSGFYFAIGVVSISAGLIVHYLRSNARTQPRPSGDGGDPAAG